MKANAPEKIYIDVSLDSAWGMTERSYDNEIEYVRKDAFIKKVVEFLNYKIKKGGYLCDSYIKQVKEEFIEDFRRYMEGE